MHNLHMSAAVKLTELRYAGLPSLPHSPSDPYENKLKTLQVKYGAKPQPT